MRIIRYLCLIVIPVNLFADCGVRGVEPDAPILCGNPVAGGFLYGQTNWDVSSSLPIVFNDGVFVLGLPMHSPDSIKLSFRKEDKTRVFTYKIRQRKYATQKISVDDKFIVYSEEVQRRIDDENEKILGARKKSEYSFANFDNWRYPFSKKYPVSGVYGSRRVFNHEPKSPHRGWDIAAPKGTPFYSVGPGRVSLVIDAYLSGKTVIISHGYGIFSAYLHMDKIAVREGDIISKDTIIGTVGDTGRTSGAHLHMGLYFMQDPLDPALLFN